MLQDIRKNSQGTVAKIIVGVIVVVFALFGVESIVGGISGEPEVATVNGQEITQSEFERAVEGKRRQILAQMGDKADPDLLDEALLRTSVLEGLINEAVLNHDAESKGIFVSDLAIDNYIRSIEQFQVDGQFSNERMQMLLRNAGLTLQAYRESLKNQFALGQSRSGLIASAFVLEDELKDIIALDRQARSFGTLTVFKSDYMDSAVVTDEEVSAYYEENKASFKKPENVEVSYIILDKEALEASVEVDGEAVKTLYESEKLNYEVEEQRAASHILIKIDDNKSEQQALEKVKEIQAKIVSGEAFEELAKVHSEDEGSAEMGGSLGLSAKGVYVSDFENALFSLNVGEISQPVKTEFGYHLIRLDSIESSDAPPFEEMQDMLASRLKKQKTDELFVRQLERLSDITYSSPDLQEAAETLGLKVESLVGVSSETTHSIFSNPKVQKILFKKELVEERHNSEVVEVEDGKAVVFRIESYTEESIQPLSAVKEEITSLLKAKQSSGFAKSVGESFIERVKSGESAKEVAQNMGLSWLTHDEIRRDNVMINREVINHLYALDKDSAGDESWFGFVTNDGDYTVINMTAVKEGSIDDINALEKTSISSMLGDTFGAGDYQIYQKVALDTAEIERRNKAAE